MPIILYINTYIWLELSCLVVLSNLSNRSYCMVFLFRLVQLATFMGGSPGVGSGKEKSNVRRVVLEARNYLRSPHPDVEIFPSQSKSVCVQ